MFGPKKDKSPKNTFNNSSAEIPLYGPRLLPIPEDFIDKEDTQNLVMIDQAVECGVFDSHGDTVPISASLHYDSTEPYTVTMWLGSEDKEEGVNWSFALELIREGVYQTTGQGDVKAWPCLNREGEAVVMIELSSPDGEACLETKTRDVYTFLMSVATEQARNGLDTPEAQQKLAHQAVDSAIERILKMSS